MIFEQGLAQLRSSLQKNPKYTHHSASAQRRFNSILYNLVPQHRHQLRQLLCIIPDFRLFVQGTALEFCKYACEIAAEITNLQHNIRWAQHTIDDIKQVVSK
jgi:hypothetical protein